MDGSSLRIPDGIEPISAFRAWTYRMEPSRATLHALGSDWEPGPWIGAERGWVTARCGAEIDHPGGVPDEFCRCGFYSMKTLPALLELLGAVIDATESGHQSGMILGRIQIAGKIIEHDFGYRAERARVAALIPREGTLANDTCLADLLGLPLTDTLPTIELPPPTPPRWIPPDGPSSSRLPVKAWVRDAA
jgi:hypothetical protein